jgi:hypothetical protein
MRRLQAFIGTVNAALLCKINHWKGGIGIATRTGVYMCAGLYG